MNQNFSVIPRLLSRSACADKNDELGWTSGFMFDFSDRTIGLRSDCPSLLESLIERLPTSADACEKESVDFLYSVKKGGPGKTRGTRHYHIMYDGCTQVERTHDLPVLLEKFEHRVGTLMIHLHYKETLITHPGYTVQLNGDAVGVVGNPGLIADSKGIFEDQGYVVSSERFLLLGHDGLARSWARDSSTEAPKLPLKRLYFLSDSQEAIRLSPGQAAMRLFPGLNGTATTYGEFLILAQCLKDCASLELPSNLIAESLQTAV